MVVIPHPESAARQHGEQGKDEKGLHLTLL